MQVDGYAGFAVLAEGRPILLVGCWMHARRYFVKALGRAWTYLRNHWDILAVVVQDGALELDNGEVERVIRGPAMGRRNWLFAGSDEGAERAATILTVLETAKRAGVDIREYLRDVLWKVAGGWKQSRLDELLPHVWAARRQSAAATSDVELGATGR